VTPAVWSGVLAGGLVLAGSVAFGRGLTLDRRARALARLSRDETSSRGAPAVPGRLARLLHDAAVPMEPRQVMMVAPALLVGSAFLGGLVGGVSAAVTGAVVSVAGPLAGLWACRHRRSILADRVLPVHLDAVSRALRGGASLRMAVIDAAGSVHGTALAERAEDLARRLAAGEPFEVALGGFGTASPLRRLVAQALGLAATLGGAPAAVVDGVADTVRERAEIAAEARALAAQARASAVVVALAPLAFALLAAMTDPRVGAFFSTPPGAMCLAAGLALDAVGAWWMGRLTRGLT
jgi:tight adherence protein B